MTRGCVGRTKKGVSCAAQAERGYLTCPQHRPQNSGPVTKSITYDRAASLSRPSRPVTNWDRDDQGKKIGLCPECGHHRWWDNRAGKRAGQWKKAGPDFKCVQCGFAKWMERAR